MSAVTATHLASAFPSALTIIAALLLILAAGFDILTRIIPNPIPLGMAAVGLALRALDGTLPWAVLAAGIVFTITLLCWLRGWMGGGDVKLLAASALLVPPISVFPMVTMVGVVGGVLALVYLTARRVVSPPSSAAAAVRPRSFLARALRAERWRLARGTALPYAVAIAIGGLIYIP